MTTTRRPNIILILVDDMGFADLGISGSEIRTPRIDSIGRNGVVFSAMYTCAGCCPTRAALLTGLYPHKAGIGHMGANLGTPACQGHLRNDSVTIAEALRAAGYFTAMSGKWHVGGISGPGWSTPGAWAIWNTPRPANAASTASPASSTG